MQDKPGRGDEANRVPSGVIVPGATIAQAQKIAEAVLRPEGSLLFALSPGPLYGQRGAFTVLEIPSAGTLLRVTRDEASVLHFSHATPGTGTRIASVRLPDFVEGSRFEVALTWSADGIALYAGFAGTVPVQAAGVTAPGRVRAVPGGLVEIGGPGIEVIGYEAFSGGELVVRETAIEAWRSTLAAIEVHMQGVPVEGYLGKVVQANLALVMLATGFEVYCGRRYRELPDEGRHPDLATFAREFTRPNRVLTAQRIQSVEVGLKVVPLDFGNYEACSRAYKSTYGLRFAADLHLPSRTLGAVRRMVEYRNRIVHVSPLIGLLNVRRVPPEAPVFSDSRLVEELRSRTSDFVEALHVATLHVP
jgi:hypothetical protein